MSNTEDLIMEIAGVDSTGIIVDDEADYRFMVAVGVLGHTCKKVEEIDSNGLSIAEVAERIRGVLEDRMTIILDGNYTDGNVLDLIGELGEDMERRQAQVWVITSQDGLPETVRETYPRVRAYQKPVDLFALREAVKRGIPFEKA